MNQWTHSSQRVATFWRSNTRASEATSSPYEFVPAAPGRAGLSRLRHVQVAALTAARRPSMTKVPPELTAELEWLNQLYVLSNRGEIDQAGMLLYEKMDLLLGAGKYETCDELLRQVRLGDLDTAIRIGFLTITSAARRHLPYRSEVYRQVEEHLRQTYPEQRVRRILVGLG